MDHVEEEDTAALIMSIDFQKAFDCLEWDFIERTLTFLNFGEVFKRWIKTLYTDISSCVLNNGWTTTFFKPSRGVRQGCPLSPYLFVICVEILAIATRENDKIKGIKIGDDTHKISQFADDTALILKYEEETLQETYKLLNEFASISGLGINLEKSVIMRIGSIKHSLTILLPQHKIQWTNESIQLLGTIIPNDRSKISELNYVPKLNKVKNIIRIWRQRNLTFHGKVQLIKTYLISQIVYLMSVLPTPPHEFIHELESILFQFLWNNKTERIKRETLHLPLTEGGISMPHLPSFNYALKLAWLRRLLDGENKGSWRSIILNQLPISDTYLWNCNLNIHDVHQLTKCIKNKFWKNVVEAWSIYNYQELVEDIDVKTQHLWYNSHIKIGNKVVFYKQWYRNGIKTIGDLLNKNGTIMTYQHFVNTYNVRPNVLAYYGILSAIPAQWKHKLNVMDNDNEVHPAGMTKFDKIMKTNKICKASYDIFREKISTRQKILKGIVKWETALSIPADTVPIGILFDNIYKSTRSRKLQVCQYQILHRSLVTNVDLFKWKLTESDQCTFCKRYPETLEHLILECTISRILWGKLKSWLRRKTGIIMNISNEVIFG